jgi:hypothetical protein
VIGQLEQVALIAALAQDRLGQGDQFAAARVAQLRAAFGQIQHQSRFIQAQGPSWCTRLGGGNGAHQLDRVLINHQCTRHMIA